VELTSVVDFRNVLRHIHNMNRLPGTRDRPSCAHARATFHALTCGADDIAILVDDHSHSHFRLLAVALS